MRVAGIREFQDRAPELVEKKEIVFITRRGKLSGVLVPLSDPARLPVEVRHELLEQIGRAVSEHLEKVGVSEEKLLRDFESWRRSRRKGRRRR